MQGWLQADARVHFRRPASTEVFAFQYEASKTTPLLQINATFLPPLLTQSFTANMRPIIC
jgi:hypothetical protein